MSAHSYVSLLDLSKQFPFEIDDNIKKAICFGETLIVSCGHYEGDIGDESSDSEGSCKSTEESEKIVHPVKEKSTQEVQDEPTKIEIVQEDDGQGENNFHFFFFPDCSKPQPPQNSKASLLIGPDGLPVINPAPQGIQFCTCGDDKDGECTCFKKLPCHCGAKVTKDCTCSKIENVCICDENNPAPVCLCEHADVCTCNSNILRPVCTCDEIEKPCICHPGKFPKPICTCKHKPKSLEADDGSEPSQIDEYEMNDMIDVIKTGPKREPCYCQKLEKKRCLCIKGKECVCDNKPCICGVQKTCVCIPESDEEVECKSQHSQSLCSCYDPPVCRCDSKTPGDCKCFPDPNANHCTCGDPKNCRCFTACECPLPCLCDMVPKEQECTCKNMSTGEYECICGKETNARLKLKKTRAGKHGYRWCHEVDPRHTFFGYAYDRHDKISYKEQEIEKLKILGLYDEKEDTGICPVHGVQAPPLVKKVRKPSLDCCSSVGGMSINVETLGEDKDKFLVQVVSHSSKEGAKAGTKLVSILDCNLHTMEENRTEHITKENFTKERRSYMAICESGYYNKVTRICGERDVVKRFYHSFEDAHHFLLEGANVVLLRYFGISRYRGNVRTETVLMDGVVCESIYVCLGVSQAIVNGKPLFVCKVERHIIEPSGVLHQTLSVLTLKGYLVSHEWADNSYIIHINPLLNIVPEKDLIEPHVPLRQNWREDLQLFSDYLDFKSTRTSEGGRYVSENGLLTNAVRDYMQALLMLRPQDALHFTRHYFATTLSALDLPHDEYFDPCNKHVRYYFFED